MPFFSVRVTGAEYPVLVERGALGRVSEFVPAGHGKLFIVTEAGVWARHGTALERGLAGRPYVRIDFPGGEARKRLSSVETMAEQMLEAGGDRTSLVIAFGGGIVNDLGGFLAAIFMRGVPVVQVPTTLLSQVDAAVGGKTGANLVSGKNLIGAFHQPRAVVVDPAVLETLPEREYRAGLFEVVKHGVIRSPELFDVCEQRRTDVVARLPEVVDYLITESVRIKCEVVSADEKENGLRKILNFGHTFGHAIEAETGYERFLHGEAVGLGMISAARLARLMNLAPEADTERMLTLFREYGPFPSTEGLEPRNLFARLAKDKKTMQGRVHFVLPVKIGDVTVVSQTDDAAVMDAIRYSLA